LAAVVNAKLTGKGRHIIISMTHSLYNHLVMPKATGKFVKALTKVTPTPEQDFLGGVLPCYRLYQTQDSRYMAVGSLELKFWQGLCQALDVNEHAASHWQMGVLPTHPQSQAAAQAIAQKFASQPLSHWQHYFTQFDVCVTPI
ncbi:CoA transferase, partial [Acinetobacter sp. TUM15521]|uniref:CoA transferase n=1 Tax=Acinetobacter sp. TUM15521 TaxID=2609156 RepID=UPI00148F405C